MNEIIIIALILGAGYLIITHRTKSEVNQSPITHSQSTQTETLTNQALEKTVDTLRKYDLQLKRI